ncbi:general transcription factor II-I repeat domain-containing protein 2B-like [Octopus sinensis]|uniref:General transcription factor II-I repeat domain-containing protein 2B-like n=1 Tax=Octopus sinensis TaxID=2607531 RepID=A0A6P7U549_9MOLL|nr:general transcription factor II-I repeat domain-containing protein 2B-like [Octopus sinensis]
MDPTSPPYVTMEEYFLSDDVKFRGRLRTTLPVVLQDDLRHLKKTLKTCDDLDELRILAQNRGSWKSLHALCAKALNISCVLNPVIRIINFVRGSSLNHRQFKVLLDDFGSEYFDLPYYTAVRWLSCGNVLNRFYKLRSEIDIFLTSKNNYYPELSDLAWLSKLSFLVDVTTHMNELNLKLQGKENLICDFYRIIKAFRQKLMLFESQLGVRQFSHFSCFKSFCEANCNEIDITFQIGIIKELKHHFLHKFSELDKIESDIILFENPFSCNVENVQHELQLEVIDLQSNEQLKDCHRRTKLAEFYEYLKDDEFPRLKNFAIKMISIFGTTYQCEQTFSRMKYVNITEKSPQWFKTQVSRKLMDGDIRAAVRVLSSADSLAESTAETLEHLKNKHPMPPDDLREFPTRDNAIILSISDDEFWKGLNLSDRVAVGDLMVSGRVI